ncbi:MAG: serine/threonine-protein phosphatase [Leptospirales bacterium]|nr:serine/threonine-protein phosphatase [Leptospirales bacterium]
MAFLQMEATNAAHSFPTSRTRLFALLVSEYGRILRRELSKTPETLARAMREGFSYESFLRDQMDFVQATVGEFDDGPSILEKIYIRFVDAKVLDHQDFDHITAKNYLLSLRARIEAILATETAEEEALRRSVNILMKVVNAQNSTFTEFNLRENAIRIELLLALKRDLGGENELYKEARNILDRHSLILINYMHEIFLERLNASLQEEKRLREELEKKRQQTEQELRMAQKIQESLLPTSFPEHVGLRFSARYLPMSSVGGDFYDVASVSLKDGSRAVGVIIADASGHGVPAAFIAAMTKMVWQSSLDACIDPADALGRINRQLLERISGNFITVGLGVFQQTSENPRKGLFHFANGGHPPCILLRHGEPPRMLEARGRIIGIFPDVQVEKKAVEYRSGDRFVFYTDGLIEARMEDGEIIGEERFLAHIQSVQRLSGEAFCDQVISFVKESAIDCSQDDDLTLFVVDVP